MKLKQKIIEWTLILLIFGITMMIGNVIGYEAAWDKSAIGMLILLAITVAGMALAEIIPVKFPSIAYITLIAVIFSLPQVPGSAFVIEMTQSINLLAITTPILAYAGISIGRNWTDFTQLGWRSVFVAALVFLGTFLGSAIVAEIILRAQGLV